MIHENKTLVKITKSIRGDTTYWYTEQVPVKLMKLTDNLQAILCIPDVFSEIGTELEMYVVSMLANDHYHLVRSFNTKLSEDILIVLDFSNNEKNLYKSLCKYLREFLYKNSIVLNSNYKVYWRKEHEFYTRQGPIGDYQIPHTKMIELQKPLYSSDDLEETVSFVLDFCHDHELSDVRETYKIKQIVGLDKYSSCVLRGGFDRQDQVLITKSYSFSRRNNNE